MAKTTVLASIISIALFSGSVAAQMAPPRSSPLARLSFSDPRLRSASAADPLEQVAPLVGTELRDGWARFTAEAGGPWQAYLDRRTGRVSAAEGSGIPWIPGDGNTLTLPEIAAALPSGKVDLVALEGIARAFLPRVAPLLGVDPASLSLSPGRSGKPSDALWLVDFDVQRGGRTIEGARVVLRVNNGNVVQFGSEGLPAPGAATPVEKVDRKQALQALSTFVGGFGAADTFLDSGSLHLLTANTSDPRFTEGFEPGNGRGLVLVWEIVFRRAKETGTWRGRIDAATGQVLEFRDVNEYAKVNGGVYTDTYATGSETVLPMPFADVSPAGTTNSAGIYTYPGGAVASTLRSLYVRIFDSCGSISQSANGSGRISFGTSSDTDCATPGTGGAGNTHSARTQFYHLNRIKEIGRGWLPANSWLNGSLNAVVNINDTCNAFWDGSSVNFFKSGGGCGNTGEIAGVSLHEYGHGLDDNDGNDISPDTGTAESYADVTAALVLHQSCVGSGFFLSGNCGGYGDPCTSCSSVRDIDWAKHASNTPHTVDNFTRARCPGSFGNGGPCGREGHCESYVISEALWDLAARDLPSPGSAGAWATTERLWYLSRSTTGSAFTCHTATSTWTSDGCAAGSLWRTFRAADDDDGNLANGTPHSCQLFAAFNRHGLACAADAGASVCFSACTPPASPSLTVTPGDGQTQLAWTSSGPGVVYDVYKSELGCGSGFIRVASGMTGTSLTDSTVVNGLGYSYQVIARPGGNDACGAAPTACQSATPQGPPCTPPAAPAGLAAQATGIDSIRLTWNPVTGATDLSVLRATTAGGPYTVVASLAATATTWTDSGLAEGTRYWYVIRAAADECVSGNSNEASAMTLACAPLTLYANDFETGSGRADWTVGSFDGGSTDRWRGIQSCTAHSGSKIFRFGGPACGDSYLDYESAYSSPHGVSGIQVPAASARTRLSFWHRWSFESCCDGGWLLLAMDGGSFAAIPGSAFLAGGYANGSSFTGTQSSFVNTVVDLDAACNLATGGSAGCAGHTLAIAFNVGTDTSVTFPGWFLDDVMVTACAAHGCTGAPAIGTAATPAANQVQVTWSNGTPASASFNVYRAFGTCAAPGAYEKIGSAVAGSPFLDTGVSGGSTYSYRVAGLDAGGLCESDLSGCVQAVPTGPCTLGPAFAGLASATDPVLTTCTINLAWAAGSSRCGGSVTYTVYRGTTPDFVPGPANAVAAGLTTTTFSDTGPLTSGDAYSYAVRAVDSSNGLNDGNLQRLSASPTGPLVVVGDRSDTFEGMKSGGGFDLTGWTHTALTGGRDWTWDGTMSQSPSHSWFARQNGSTADQVLVSPLFVVQSGTVLSFWHAYGFELGFDGGTLEISTDHGASWSVLPDSAFTAGGFNATLYSGTGNPIAGRRGWTGDGLSWSQVKVNLSSWAGSEIQVRWHAGEDGSVRYTGWFVDSVNLNNAGISGSCMSAPPPPLRFYTLPPCRLADTRNPNGPLGGPALQPGTVRPFTLTGVCGVPVTAKALSLNVTVTQPGAPGFLTLYPGGQLKPQTSSINFAMGQTRANNAVLPLGDGTGILQVFTADGPVHLILDVNGYFQ
ncbi:MAG TPA: hypothetical protein VHC97_14535 [Thermoanaerobaculia bacterium]|nr:hypothetical protein [Thermoanaerobaculia bacterium]